LKSNRWHLASIVYRQTERYKNGIVWVRYFCCYSRLRNPTLL